jgi:hypothetical protein
MCNPRRGRSCWRSACAAHRMSCGLVLAVDGVLGSCCSSACAVVRSASTHGSMASGPQGPHGVRPAWRPARMASGPQPLQHHPAAPAIRMTPHGSLPSPAIRMTSGQPCMTIVNHAYRSDRAALYRPCMGDPHRWPYKGSVPYGRSPIQWPLSPMGDPDDPSDDALAPKRGGPTRPAHSALPGLPIWPTQDHSACLCLSVSQTNRTAHLICRLVPSPAWRGHNHLTIT